MENVYPIAEYILHDSEIGIVISQDSGQFHCGISYGLKEGFNILHLAWHYCLRYTSNVDDFVYWIKPNIHPFRQKMLSIKCETINRAKDIHLVPYALLYDGAVFDDSGILHLGEREHGLTCATFVLAIFKSCGIELIDCENWPIREDDESWHERIISILEEYLKGKNSQHVENVKKEKGCARYRPEEVGMSSTFSLLPAPSVSVIEKGKELHELMMQQCN